MPKRKKRPLKVEGEVDTTKMRTGHRPFKGQVHKDRRTKRKRTRCKQQDHAINEN